MDEGHSVREVHSEGEELKYIWEEEKQQEEEGDLTPEVIEQMCVCVCVYTILGYLPVLSGIEAWSLFLSFLKTMLPNWRTEDTTFNMATNIRIQRKQNYLSMTSFYFINYI